jgi:DNA-binding PucR family transcriptional regulator
VVPLLEQVGRARCIVVAYSDRSNALTSIAADYRVLQQGLPFLAAAMVDPGAVPSLIVRFHRTLFAGTSAERLELAREVLEPVSALPPREAAELFDVLDAMYECGPSPSVLAHRLHVHKNTIGNRLRRVRELTGLDLRRPSQRLVLETSLRMRRLADLDA